jgi:hypothetical protein
MTMCRLLVICATVLAIVGLTECGKVQRQAMRIEERYNTWLRAEYVRAHPLEQKPSVEIDPGLYRGKEKL